MLITTKQQLKTLLERLHEARHIAFDTETTGLSAYTGDRIIGLSFGIPGEGQTDTFYVPFRHNRGSRLNLPPACLKEFAPLFADEGKTWIGWNAKFDCHMLWVDKIEIKGRVLDAMLAWHLVDENQPNYALKDMATRKLGADNVISDKELQLLLRSEKMDKSRMAELSPIEAAAYAENDALLTWRLFREAYRRLKLERLTELFSEVCEYARVLERCERKGFKVAAAQCEELIEAAQSRDVELLEQLREMTSPSFNPNSSAQVCNWLGLKSSAKAVLQEMEDAPGVAELLEYRGHAKAVSSFYLPLRNRRDRFDRVHPSFKVHGTVSGRLSCAEPNMMNLPRKSAQWAKVKKIIIAGTGCKLVSTDLSQAEFRLMAHYVQDPNLIRAYCEGSADMHQFVADELGIDRQDAKTLNFSIIYGGGVNTIYRQLGMTEDQALKLLTRYHRRIPGLRPTSRGFMRLAEEKGFVNLWSGRRRRFPYVNGVRIKTHTAMNNVIQGGVAEIVRVAMCRIDELLPEGAYMLGQVHDEVLVECKTRQVADVAYIVKRELENAAVFRVPMTADQKVGKSWGEMESYK